MSQDDKITGKDAFVERLKRVINGESVRGFAHKCGISEGALRNYLSGGEPTRPALIAITAATGVSLLWLSAGQGRMWGKDAAQSSGTEPEHRSGLNRELSALVRQLLSEREQLEKQIDLLTSENEELRSLLANQDNCD